MAKFDWLSSSQFSNEIQRAIARAATARGMSKGYSAAIPDWVENQIAQRRQRTIAKEQSLTEKEQRTIDDAIASVEKLISDAAARAAGQNRSFLDLADVEGAYQDNFCSYWPVC